MFDWRLFASVVLLVGCATATAPAALLTFEEITQATAFRDSDGVVDDVPEPSDSDGKIHRPGELSSLVGTVDGITVTIRRQGGAAFDIIDNAAQLALSNMSKQDLGESLPNGRWGTRSLDPFVSLPDKLPKNGTSPALIIEFSVPVRVVSLRVGDFDTSPTNEDDFLRLLAFSQLDAKGTQIDIEAPTNLTAHPTLGFNQKRLTVTDTNAGIRSVLLQAGAGPLMNFSDFLSVFIDRIYFDNQSLLLPENIDDENNNGDNVFGTEQQAIPEPASAALLLLSAAALLTRRPRRA